MADADKDRKRQSGALAGVRTQLSLASDHLMAATAQLATVEARLEGGIEGTFNDPLKPQPTDPTERRRMHLGGKLSRLETDTDLRAFVLARIETETFPAIAKAVAQAFPPDRRVSMSSIHRYWQKHFAARVRTIQQTASAP